jgi:hypothetical protein
MTNAEKKSLAEWFFGLKRKLVKAFDTVIDKTAPISPAPEPPHWSSSPDGHTKMLASLVCECGEAKQVGHYFCVPCREPRKR